jgi:hypothetical protein
MVFHGHAHRGRPEGRTSIGIPVYNVSYPLLHRMNADRPYRIIEVPGTVGSIMPGGVVTGR